MSQTAALEAWFFTHIKKISTQSNGEELHLQKVKRGKQMRNKIIATYEDVCFLDCM